MSEAIVLRLRNYADNVIGPVDTTVVRHHLRDAADEIERLQRALYWAHVGTPDDPAEVVVLDHSTGTARLADIGRSES